MSPGTPRPPRRSGAVARRSSGLLWLSAVAAHLSLALIAAALVLELRVRSVDLPDLARLGDRSPIVAAADGQVLWGFLSTDEKWRLGARIDGIDPEYLRLLVGYEDKRFYRHRGVDLLALARAAMQAVRHGRVVSGGSTLTMQLVRLLDPRPRSLASKLDQAVKALRLERALTKTEILAAYLTLAPFGGNIEGVRAATHVYFGKEPAHLSLAEAALLIAVPQSPERRRPDLHAGAARAARDLVLARLERRGLVEPARAARGRSDRLAVAVRPFKRLAPHLARRVRPASAADGAGRIDSLIDPRLQRHVEQVARRAVAAWDDGVNLAIVVMRNRDGAITAYLGGVDPYSDRRSGHVDLAAGVRSPGSTLKPFIYAIAFERLLVHPDTTISDEPVDFQGYAPLNADRRFWGEITIREALLKSVNTAAVAVLDAVGVEPFLLRFRATGEPLRLPDGGDRAGLAVALGGVGVTLEQLTAFYSVFPNRGVLVRPRLLAADPVRRYGRFIDPRAADAVTDILADMPPPPGLGRGLTDRGGRRIGYKTGTSYGFRDAWAVGFDRQHTVGVWVGRPDGSAHLGSYGLTAAAPVLMRVFAGLPRPRADILAGRAVAGPLRSPRSLPPRLQRHRHRGAPDRRDGLTIRFPRDGSEIRAATAAGQPYALKLAASGGRGPFRWVVSGKDAATTDRPVTTLTVRDKGQYDIAVIDAAGAVARTSFWIDFAR